MFENKDKILTSILTEEQQHQAKTFFHHADTLPSQYYNNGMGEYLYGEKFFRFGADVPLPERRSKLENNWESTNNLKLWLLNISRDFLLCKIVAATYVVDSYKTFSLLTTPFDRAVGSSPKCIRKKPVRRIQKNLKNIIWYSSYESSKTGKFYTFLVSFIITLLWP